MQKDFEDIKAEEKAVLEKYISERKKVSDNFFRKIHHNTHIDHIIGSMTGGVVLGCVFSAILANTNSKTPVRDQFGRVVEYKTDYDKLQKTTMLTIAATLLAALAFADIATKANSQRDHLTADMLSHDTFKRFFEKPLDPYFENTSPMQVAYAISLIVNNMSSSDLSFLRKLAIGGFNREKNGCYTVYQRNVDSAARIISKYINTNPELGYNVLRIMRGEKPTTYFLSSMVEKTR